MFYNIRWLINKRNLFLTVLKARKCKVKVPVDSMPDENSLPRWLSSHSHMVEGVRELSGVSLCVCVCVWKSLRHVQLFVLSLNKTWASCWETLGKLSYLLNSHVLIFKIEITTIIVISDVDWYLWLARIHLLESNSHIFGGEVFGRLLDHDGRALMNGISALL